MRGELIEERRGFRAPGTGFMITGGLIGAVGAYLFQVYGGRELGPEAFAPIGVLWTAFFILATVLLMPLEQYVTREVASGHRALPADLRPAAVVAGVGAVVGGGFVVMTLDTLFAGSWQYVAQMVLLITGYSLLFVGKGVLAGRRRFASVGWLLIIETAVRLAVGVFAVSLVARAESLGWAMVMGGLSVLAMGWWRHDRGRVRAKPGPAREFLSGYVGGTAASQLLLAGAPIAVAALGADPALVSVVFVTFTLYRAPLTLIFSLQGRVLPYLVGLVGTTDHHQLGRIARRVMLGGTVLVLVGGGLGWLVGPEVVGLLFGAEFAPHRVVAALAAAGVIAAASAQVTAQVLVAEGRTARLSVGWAGGLVVGLAVLLLASGGPDLRVAVAFAAGETVAFALMAGLAARR